MQNPLLPTTTEAPTEGVWPSARRPGVAPVQHAAWEAARNAILDLAAAGPATVALIGAPGTGKSWLLRELAAALGEHGFPTMMVLQGDLPVALSDGAALLVDEALRMPEAELDALLAQTDSFVVLADVERFADSVAHRPNPPVVVPIQGLTDLEAHDFAVDWLSQRGLAPADVAPDVLDRVIVHAGGTVRLIAQLLGAAVAMRNASGQTHLTAADVDQAAVMRQVWSPDAPAAAPDVDDAIETSAPIAVRTVRRHRMSRAILPATALAACVALAWALRPVTPAPVEIAERPPHVGLPPLQTAESLDPMPAQVTAAEPALLPRPAVAALSPMLAELAPEPEPEPVILGAPTDPAVPVPAFVPARRSGGPGIVLLAQRGDTLESLYNDFYRDRSAPPYAEIVAVNPRPLHPGAIVIFPEPQGGWSASQR